VSSPSRIERAHEDRPDRLRLRQYRERREALSRAAEGSSEILVTADPREVAARTTSCCPGSACRELHEWAFSIPCMIER